MKLKRILLICAIAIGVFFMATHVKCNRGMLDELIAGSIIERVEPIFTKPSWWTHAEVESKPLATIRYKTPPPVSQVSGGTIYPNGDIELEFRVDSTLFALHRFDIGGYHGRGRIWIDSLGAPRISYPRWGFDPAVVFGPSLRGATCALEHVYVNNFLGVTHIHPLTPLVDIELWQPGETRDISLGVGVTADLAPRWSSALRLGFGWQWSVHGGNGPTAFVGVAIP